MKSLRKSSAGPAAGRNSRKSVQQVAGAQRRAKAARLRAQAAKAVFKRARKAFKKAKKLAKEARKKLKALKSALMPAHYPVHKPAPSHTMQSPSKAALKPRPKSSRKAGPASFVAARRKTIPAVTSSAPIVAAPESDAPLVASVTAFDESSGVAPSSPSVLPPSPSEPPLT
jgi:hypothetical protein